MLSIPDFFQDESEESLRLQVDWLEQHLGWEDSFFARFLREDRGVFVAWRAAGSLAKDKERALRELWCTALHLLSFQHFDAEKVRRLAEQTTPRGAQAVQSLFSPPWSGSSLKEYLGTHGADALGEVDRWVESFRFGDPYAHPRRTAACRSTPA